MTLLGAAQERGKRLETELKDVDDTVRNQLLATWKELILEEMVELFAITDDPQVLRYLDSNIALGQEITRGKKMMVTIDRAVTASGSAGTKDSAKRPQKRQSRKLHRNLGKRTRLKMRKCAELEWRRGGDSTPRYPY